MLHQRLGHAWPLHQADSPEPGFEERGHDQDDDSQHENDL